VVTVSPRVEGFVEKLYANFTGQEVRAGEPLLEFHSPMVAATAEDLQVAIRLAEDVAESSEESRASAERLVRAARERLLAWKISPTQVEHVEEHGASLRSVVLQAPASGVVLDKNVLLGQRIMEGDVLYRIADLATVWIEGEVFEQDLAAVRMGQQVQVDFQALPGVTRTGRITYIYQTLSPETRTGKVRVALANPGLVLKPGMFATLRFSAVATGPVLSIPRSAVLSTGERSLVFVRSPDGRFTPVDIVLGAQTENRVEVRRGLSAGDMVVASATFLVDAESNLGSLLGGMGDMPGMDLTAPAATHLQAGDTTHPGGAPAPPPGKATKPTPAPMQTPVPAPPAGDTAAHQHGGT
jgi:Cu(I)/Ag(I) efflux system membrane fusion protein